MVKSLAATDWREARRRSAREAIVDAAWELVGEEGLAGLSLRDLARRVGDHHAHGVRLLRIEERHLRRHVR